MNGIWEALALFSSRLNHRRRRLAERVDPGGEREQVRVILLEMPGVGEPFAGKPGIRPLDVGGQVGVIGRRQALQRFRAHFQLLDEMKNRPEQVGEAFVFEQVGILQQAEEEAAVGGEAGAEVPERVRRHPDVIRERLRRFSRPGERLFVPVSVEGKLRRELGDVVHEKGEFRQEVPANGAEKRADDHVHFFQPGFFLTAGENVLENQGHDQDVKEQESDIADQPREDFARPAEDQVVGEVNRRRCPDHRQGQAEAPVPEFFHIIFPSYRLRLDDFVFQMPLDELMQIRSFPSNLHIIKHRTGFINPDTAATIFPDSILKCVGERPGALQSGHKHESQRLDMNFRRILDRTDALGFSAKQHDVLFAVTPGLDSPNSPVMGDLVYGRSDIKRNIFQSWDDRFRDSNRIPPIMPQKLFQNHLSAPDRRSYRTHRVCVAPRIRSLRQLLIADLP